MEVVNEGGELMDPETGRLLVSGGSIRMGRLQVSGGSARTGRLLVLVETGTGMLLVLVETRMGRLLVWAGCEGPSDTNGGTSPLPPTHSLL